MSGEDDAFVAKLTSEFMGASYSIDVLAPAAWFEFGVPIDDLLCVVDKRLRLRCILGPEDYDLPTVLEASEGETAEPRVFDGLAQLGWDVRAVDRRPSASCIIIDQVTAVIFDHSSYQSGRSDWFTVEQGEESVLPYLQHFDELFAADHPILLYENIFPSPVPPKIFLPGTGAFWDQLINELQITPERLLGLPPRKFEELVAELLRRHGMEVQLTPEKADGGFDVLAAASGPIGKQLYLVECKRYTKRPVGVEIVRALYGVVEAKSATAGLVVTTSSFTKGAKAFRTSRENRLALRDYKDLVEWLRKPAGKANV